MSLFVHIENGTSLATIGDAVVYDIDDDDDDYTVEAVLSGDDPFDDDVTFKRRFNLQDLLGVYEAAMAFVRTQEYGTQGESVTYEALASAIAIAER